MRNFRFLQPALVALVLLLGVLVRVGHFPHVPPGFNQDEAASAYEAYSLAETGSDKWGNHLPVYFPAWGSGQNVLLAYLTVPAVKVFGLSVGTARIVSLLLALLTLPLFYFCLRRLGRFPALLGTLLLALAPWHFMLAHWALESNLAPFFMLLGCALLIEALSTQRQRWIVPALLPFAFSLYAYGTTIVVLPPMLGLLALLYWRQVWARRGPWLLALALFGVVAAPWVLFFCENYLAKHNFAWTDSLFFSTPLLSATRVSQVSDGSWLDILQRNWRFISSGFNDGSSYNQLAGYPLLLSLTMPFAVVAAVVGGWKLLRRRGALAAPSQVVLAVFGAWGLGALALVVSFDLNINRFNHAYLPCLALAAWALALTIASFGPTVSRPALRLGVVAWVLLEGGLAVRTYFTDFPHGPIRADMNEGLGEAFTKVAEMWGIEQVLITEQMPLPYVYTAFFLRYPPAQFQQEVQMSVQPDGVYRVRRLGRYYFGPGELPAGKSYGYLSRLNEFADAPGRHRQVLFTNDLWEVGMMQVTAVP